MKCANKRLTPEQTADAVIIVNYANNGDDSKEFSRIVNIDYIDPSTFAPDDIEKYLDRVIDAIRARDISGDRVVGQDDKSISSDVAIESSTHIHTVADR